MTMADGRTCTESLVCTKSLALASTLPNSHERNVFTVFPLTRYDAIRGKPWLEKNNPSINYSTNEFQFGTSCSWTAHDTSATVSKHGVQLNFISGKQARHALCKGEEGFLPRVTSEDQPGAAGFQDAIDTSSDSHMMEKQELLTLLEYSDVFPNNFPQDCHRREA